MVTDMAIKNTMMIINDIKKEKKMNKHNLLKRIASVATELDMKGFTKEAKHLDSMLLRLAMDDDMPEIEKSVDSVTPTFQDWEGLNSLNGILISVLGGRKDLDKDYYHGVDIIMDLVKDIFTELKNFNKLNANKNFEQKQDLGMEIKMLLDTVRDETKALIKEFGITLDMGRQIILDHAYDLVDKFKDTIDDLLDMSSLDFLPKNDEQWPDQLY
jgi:hypothetical protein